ncbi:PQQ-dependent sugar dehydrogenase [Flavobacterium sp. RHBU_24]|uniref:PQQ-dependent sugar dehydrogenase n=1 Tax=Flavobacterium sp. RHBU_24 TaxID=3391185 RepID=UPI00398500B9
MKTALLSSLLLCTAIGFSQSIALEEFATGISQPTEIAHAGDARLFVTQQDGLIKIINADGTVNPIPFLDVTALTDGEGERGLLGLAFHPDYADNGYFYINYTNLSGNTIVARYARSSTDANVANAASAQILLTVTQPFSNHNGGGIRFGPDGYLYIGMGDGGSGGDPNGNGQNNNTLLGKMLRIDVNDTDTYSIPEDNPYVGVDGADEIWATGLRNPWKFSFNRENGDLWIADVGQNVLEEINHAAANEAGLNYGWRCFEGTQVYNSDGCSIIATYTQPVAEYDHANNACSVTGGFVYTGALYPQLAGKYIFADYCSNRIGITDTSAEITWTAPFSGSNFSTFGEDMDGELYVAARSQGKIYKIIETTAATVSFSGNNVRLYPNPAKNVLNIEATAPLPFTVKIYDISGKQLVQQDITTAQSAINISRLSAGVYIAELRSGTETMIRKLVVQ